MTSRERVRRAIHFLGPDRVPHLLPDDSEDDLLAPSPDWPADILPWTEIDGGRQRRIDFWGVTWETMGAGTFGEAVAYPITDITVHTVYQLPDLNTPDVVRGIRAVVVANSVSENPKYCLGTMPFLSLNEGTHNLMGLDEMFAAYYESPDALKAFLARMAAAQRDSIRLLADCGCDGVMGFDDWGLQDRPMISPSLFEEFFLPLYRESWQLAHTLGLDVWMHSCGHILDLLPMFIDAGLDVIQMDQQENMGLDTLNAIAGGRLAFWCPVDIQRTMVEGSIDAIRAYVKQMISTLGARNGGLISKAYPSPEAVNHPPEKIAAMCAAFREYGTYVRNDTMPRTMIDCS